MSRRVLIRVNQGESIEIACEGGAEPSGVLLQAARRALYSAKARAGGELDVPGRGETCLVKPSDTPLAVGAIVCTLLGDGYVAEIAQGSVPFDDVS